MNEFLIWLIVAQLAIISWVLQGTNAQLRRIADQAEKAGRK
jgi:hypothetical protein